MIELAILIAAIAAGIVFGIWIGFELCDAIQHPDKRQ